MKLTVVILAAGQGTRMRSALPKVLHAICGRPLIHYSLDLARALSPETPVVVVGHGANTVRQSLGDAARFVVQEQQLGTGHAVQCSETLLSGQTDLVVVLNADMPLFTQETLQSVVDTQLGNRGPATMLSMVLEDSHGFGRVVRSADGGPVQAIVEEAQATPEQLKINELNVGVYCFNANWLWQALKRVPLSPKGEYYLTDVVGIAVNDGQAVQAVRVSDPSEAIGINNRVHLAEAEGIMRKRINKTLMEAGVTLVDPANTYIDAQVSIGRDSVVYPNSFLHAGTTVGENCTIGPGTVINGAKIGNHCALVCSVIEKGAHLEDHARVGPFEHFG